jgi:hypothetical protein
MTFTAVVAQLSVYKLAQMQGSSGSSFSTPPGKKS